MRVLIVIESLGYGGAERLLVTLAPALMGLGIHCEIAALGSFRPLAEEFASRGVKVHTLNSHHRWWLPGSVFDLRRLCRSGRFDLIWSHLYFGNLNAAFVKMLEPRLKVVTTLHSPVDADSSSRLWDTFRRWLQRWTGALADRIVAVSSAVAEEHERLLGWRGILVVHNAVATDAMPPQPGAAERIEVRRARGLPDDGFCLAVPARFVRDKGHAILLQALALLANERGWTPHAVFVGDGPLKPEFLDTIRALGLSRSVGLIEPMPQAELFHLMQACDAVVLPSRREPFGIAAAESMALGIPTIVSAVDGLLELAGDGDAALLVPPEDARALADALWRLQGDPGLRARLSTSGSRRVRQLFSSTAAGGAWAKLLKEVESRQ